MHTPRELTIYQFYFCKGCYKISQTVVPPSPPASVVSCDAYLPFVIRVNSFPNDGVISIVLPKERGFLFWLLHLFSILNNKNAVAKNSI